MPVITRKQAEELNRLYADNDLDSLEFMVSRIERFIDDGGDREHDRQSDLDNVRQQEIINRG